VEFYFLEKMGISTKSKRKSTFQIPKELCQHGSFVILTLTNMNFQGGKLPSPFFNGIALI